MTGTTPGRGDSLRDLAALSAGQELAAPSAAVTS